MCVCKCERVLLCLYLGGGGGGLVCGHMGRHALRVCACVRACVHVCVYT